MLKSADYIIDIGPDAGVDGGKIVTESTSGEIAANPKSITGNYLKEILAKLHKPREE